MISLLVQILDDSKRKGHAEEPATASYHLKQCHEVQEVMDLEESLHDDTDKRKTLVCTSGCIKSIQMQ